ncbi:alpha/beta fold hydrolase [Actinoallomurus rhizosphaericola]|uniref:alpha/beta fold hydrolase n=1 Tax=Actinoallomurus rhizosphaericola TaxID=2952536 RepID=UPI00209005B0|nr:alpha/beta hydrolase [Actinoallomurus rhizosphaericola]MCO5992519.1 alpha/beta hydrolase [Actinoallomurus rhizosphaericola]
MSTPIPQWPGELVRLGDREVFVRTASSPREDADPALFVHGLAGSSANWTDLMGLLSDEIAGEAVDLPGFGHSPPPPDHDYSVDAHTIIVARLIEKRGRGPVHLFGNSLGGAIATRLAGTRPDLVRSLTLIAPALPDLRPRYGPARILAASVPGVGPWAVRRLAALPAEQRVQGTLEMCFADPTGLHPDRVMELVEDVRRRDGLTHNAEALIASSRGIVTAYMRRSLWRYAARVIAPTLVIYGRHDRLVDPRMAARAGRVFKRSRVVVLPDVGHVAQMERPEAVAREFRAMLEDAGAGMRRRVTEL